MRVRIEIYKVILFAMLFTIMMLSMARASNAALGIDFLPQLGNSQSINENGGPDVFGASGGYTVVGWKFTTTADLYLTSLGVYDSDSDKTHPESHYVGIWDSPNHLLASVTISEAKKNIPETTPLGAMFHFADLQQQVLLTKGTTYYVAATLFAGNSATDFDQFASFDKTGPYATTVQLNPYITYLGNAYAVNSTNNLLFPNLTSDISDYTIGADIKVTPTPVPAAALLFGSGMLGLLGIRRKN